MSTLILALNPSVDVEWHVDNVVWEEKNIVRTERRWPGGKGINVARWLKFLRGNPLLILPLGGANGQELSEGLRKERIPTKVVQLEQNTRANIIVTSERDGQMRFNPPGPKLSALDWKRIVTIVRRQLSKAELMVLSGSLPPGAPVTAYRDLIRIAAQKNVRTVLDCDGDAFAAAIGAHPFLVKPNEHELAQWARKPLRTEKEIVHAAIDLSAVTHGWVLVSRGSKRSLLVNASEGLKLSAEPKKMRPVNTVGAGDALVAAVARAVELGHSPMDWLRSGVSTGTKATQLPAGKLPVTR
jgi:1-phosphofructokinase family hexose kinase